MLVLCVDTGIFLLKHATQTRRKGSAVVQKEPRKTGGKPRRERWRSLAIALCLGLAAASPLRAGTKALPSEEERLAEGPTIADLVAYAYAHGPRVKEARAAWRGASAREGGAGYLPNPEVMVDGMWMTETLGEEAAPPTWKLTLSQSFPLPGKLGAEERVAAREVEMARLALDAAVRDAVTRVRESASELTYQRAARLIAEKNAALADHVRTLAETGRFDDRSTRSDVMRAQAQIGQTRYDALLLKELEETEKTRLNAELGREPDAPLGPIAAETSASLRLTLEEVYAAAEKNWEELRIARAEIARAESVREVARYETLPGFRVGLTMGEDQNNQVVGGLVGMSLPLWGGKNRAVEGTAAAGEERARAKEARARSDMRTRVRDAWFRLTNAERLARLYREELVPQAARAVEQAETWQRQGEGSLSDLAEVQAALYNFELAKARAEADRAIYLSRLEALAGVRLTGDAPVGEETR